VVAIGDLLPELRSTTIAAGRWSPNQNHHRQRNSFTRHRGNHPVRLHRTTVRFAPN